MAYDVLVRRENSCPPGCRLCEEACRTCNSSRGGSRGATEDGNGRVSALRHVDMPEAAFHGLATCGQCGEPACLEICPSGAISKSSHDGVVRIAEEKCVGCGMCSLACPYGGATFSPERGKAEKCDLCDGNPACVKACPYGTLQFFQSSRVEPYFSDQDFLSPGTRGCPGCAAELTYRSTLKVLGRYDNVIVFGCPGCMTTLMNGFGTMAGSRVTYVSCLFTNVFSSMSGVSRYYRHVGRDVKPVAFVGDGCIADVSFQSLSGAAERGEQLVVICYDNEGYQNTGNQRSSTTPMGARTYTTPVGAARKGKVQQSKDVPLIMASHNIPYVATATIAHMEDYLKKLTRALAVQDGMAYLHVLAPCPPGWGSAPDISVELSRSAVETNYFPLWECDNGKFALTYEPKSVKPVREFLRLMSRFAHLDDEGIDEFQHMVDERFDHVKFLSKRV